MKSLLIVLSAALGLTACASSTKPVATTVPLPMLPSNLMADCPQLPKIETDKLPDLAGHLLLTSHAYSDCAARHHLLVKRVKAREEARK